MQGAPDWETAAASSRLHGHKYAVWRAEQTEQAASHIAQASAGTNREKPGDASITHRAGGAFLTQRWSPPGSGAAHRGQRPAARCGQSPAHQGFRFRAGNTGSAAAAATLEEEDQQQQQRRGVQPTWLGNWHWCHAAACLQATLHTPSMPPFRKWRPAASTGRMPRAHLEAAGASLCDGT